MYIKRKVRYLLVAGAVVLIVGGAVGVPLAAKALKSKPHFITASAAELKFIENGVALSVGTLDPTMPGGTKVYADVQQFTPTRAKGHATFSGGYEGSDFIVEKIGKTKADPGDPMPTDGWEVTRWGKHLEF